MGLTTPCLAVCSGKEEVEGSGKKFTENELRTERGMEPLRLESPAELTQVVAG